MKQITDYGKMISLRCNAARDFVEALATLWKKYPNMKLYTIMTPSDNEIDPITFEETGKKWEDYHATIFKK